jgi:type IV pilus assembly protein PilW
MQMFRIRVTGYYIGYNATTGEPGLYRADLSEGTDGLVTEELVEGVETMQILYGYSLPIDQGGDGQSVDFWLPADEVPDWQFVIGVRMSLLLRSPDNMADGAARQTFDLASTQFTHPEDRRLRQPFFTSISLRNRQLVL